MKSLNNGPVYHNLIVKSIIKETRDCISIVFHHPPNEKIVYKAGQFLTLIFKVESQEVRRAYSLSSSPFVENDLRVSVKRVEKGVVSNWVIEHLTEGDKVLVMAPAGNFTTEFHPSYCRRLIMFAGGSGITPLRSIILSLLVQEPSSTCSLIYCNRDMSSIIFKDELEEFQNIYPNRFRLFHIIENPPENWVGYGTKLTHDGVVLLLNRLPKWSPQNTNFFLCGPEGMIRIVENALASQNVPPTIIVKERFVTTAASTDFMAIDQKTFEVDRWITLHFKMQITSLFIKHSSTILEAALEYGLELPYSCKSGICTSCRAKCKSGRVKQDVEGGLSLVEQQEGYILTCVGHPITDDVVIDADQT